MIGEFFQGNPMAPPMYSGGGADVSGLAIPADGLPPDMAMIPGARAGVGASGVPRLFAALSAHALCGAAVGAGVGYMVGKSIAGKHRHVAMVVGAVAGWFIVPRVLAALRSSASAQSVQGMAGAPHNPRGRGWRSDY